jgi:PAS domain S-box-containing protein
MKLRTILLVLSILAFLSASTGGYLYYLSLKEAALKEANRQALTNVEMISRNLSFFLSENIKPVRTLAGMTALTEALVLRSSESLAAVNAVLDHFKETLNVEVCYLMDQIGNTIASSNRHDPDSFVGNNFDFRPYFQQAMDGAPATYLALGTTSGRRGVYFSHPIYETGRDVPLGVVVIKASIELIEKTMFSELDEIVMLADPRGVVFISNRQNWLYHTLGNLSAGEQAIIERSLQFGKGPWKWTGLRTTDRDHTLDSAGNEYLMHQVGIDNYPGWHVIYLRSLEDIYEKVVDPLISITGPIILVLCLLIGLSVFFLYRKASHEIDRRRVIEKTLRESEERYRSIYHNAPAMLHSVNKEGILVRVSDHWLNALGYTREEVIGQKLIRFLSEASGRYVQETIIPDFFQTGFVKDIPYRFVRKDGATIDALVSAIGERDGHGNVIRSLAVSVDITERKQAEEALRLAKEKLAGYSRELEDQVKIRTKEISSILKYTPAVVYMKDIEGRYILVNPRFEELFGIANDEIRGKIDQEIFPKDVAEKIRSSDLKVLTDRRSYQVEESIPQKDGLHIYLSVKFPIYEESGTPRICGILTDITDVKKAQDQLRRLSGAIMAGQEKERSVIARELHDELGQVLTALHMDAVWIQNRLQAIDPETSARVQSMCSLIDNTIEEVRSLATRLRPGVLDSLGLVDALEWHTTDFERRTDIICIFEHDNVPIVNDALATAAYRITQEALTNVARHAGANKVEVILQNSAGLLTLSVVDDGCGFRTEILKESEGLGVAGMRERAGLVGGVLEVESEPDLGTRIHFKVPFED